jgi:hypothetical protein
VVGGESAISWCECVGWSADSWAPFTVDGSVGFDCGFASRSVCWFVDLGGDGGALVTLLLTHVVSAQWAGLHVWAPVDAAHLEGGAGH